MAKLTATDMAMGVTTDMVQVLGGAGYVEDHPLERYMREAKVLQIVEGTNQIQRMVIARSLRPEPRRPDHEPRHGLHPGRLSPVRGGGGPGQGRSPRRRARSWSTVDVDADPDDRAEYGDRVPVILVDGVEHGYYRVEPDRLRRALSAAGEPP